MKHLIEIDYPIGAVLSTNQDLKPFKYGCNQRTKILRDFLKREYRKHNWIKKQINHHISDYIVEDIIKENGQEIGWIIGS